MVQLAIAAALIASGVVIALVIRRRDGRAPAKGANWSVPVQLHRADFDDPTAPRLVVVFSSATCDACAGTWERVRALADAGTAVQQVSFQDQQKLHDRYGIDAVPTVVVADAEGVVVASFVGPPSESELAEALTAEG